MEKLHVEAGIGEDRLRTNDGIRMLATGVAAPFLLTGRFTMSLFKPVLAIAVTVSAAVAPGCGRGYQTWEISGQVFSQNRPDSELYPATRWSSPMVVLAALKTDTMVDGEGRFRLTAKGRPGCYRALIYGMGLQTLVYDFLLESSRTVSLDTILLQPDPFGAAPARKGTCTPTDTLYTWDWPAAATVLELRVLRPDSTAPDSVGLSIDLPCARDLRDPRDPYDGDEFAPLPVVAGVVPLRVEILSRSARSQAPDWQPGDSVSCWLGVVAVPPDATGNLMMNVPVRLPTSRSLSSPSHSAHTVHLTRSGRPE